MLRNEMCDNIDDCYFVRTIPHNYSFLITAHSRITLRTSAIMIIGAMWGGGIVIQYKEPHRVCSSRKHGHALKVNHSETFQFCMKEGKKNSKVKAFEPMLPVRLSSRKTTVT